MEALTTEELIKFVTDNVSHFPFSKVQKSGRKYKPLDVYIDTPDGKRYKVVDIKGTTEDYKLILEAHEEKE